MAATNLGTLIVELLLKDGQFKSGLKSSTAEMNSASGIMGSAATKMANVTATAMKAAAASMAAFASASVVVGSNFEQQMAMVGALKGLDQTDQAFQQLEKQARFLGATTEFTATQAGEALESLARAGVSVNDAIRTSGDALTLAGTSATTLDNATQLLVSTQRQFGMTADESSRITNVMSMAMRSSLLDFTSLREGMKYAGATGHGFNMTLEETTAALAKFRDLGMEGSMAGTQFRSAMAFAGAETLKQTKVLKKYGLTTKDINPETHTFAQILQTVGKAGLTTTDSMKVFGRIAGGAMAQLARGAADGSLQMEELIEKLEQSSDEGNTAQEMYNAIAETVRFKAKIAASALQELLITFFDLFKGPLKDLVAEIPNTLNIIATEFQQNSFELKQQFEEAFGAMTDFLKGNAEDWGKFLVNLTKMTIALVAAMMPLVEVLNLVAQNIAEIAGVMGTLFAVKAALTFVGVVNKIAIAFGAASSAVTAFGMTMTVTSGGLFAAVAAVGAITAALVSYISMVRKARNETQLLEEAQQRLEEERKKIDAAELERTERMMRGAQLIARRRLEEEELSNAERARLEGIINLTAAEAHRQIQAGKLLNVNEQLFTVQQLVNEMGIEATVVMKERAEALDREAKKLADHQEELKGYHLQIQKQTRETDKASQVHFFKTNKAIAKNLNSEQEYVAKIGDLKRQQNEFEERAANIRNEVAKAISAANKEQMESTVETTETEVAATGQAVDKMIAHRKRLADRIKKLRDKIHEDYMKATLDERAFFRFESQQELADINAAYAEYRAAHEGNEAKQRQIDIEAMEARLEFIKTRAIAYNNLITKSEDETADDVYNINAEALERLQDLRAQGLSESEQLEREKNRVLAELAEADAATRLAIYFAYQDQIDKLRRQEKLDNIRGFGWDKVFDFIKTGLSELFPRITEGLAKVGVAAKMSLDVIKAGVGAVGMVFDKLAQFTGFQFDPMSMAQDLADAKAKAEEEGLDFNLEREARKMVRTMVNEAILFVEALVEALPFFLDALINQLPKLFTAIVNAIPKIIEALVAAIPRLVQMIIENLPDIILALFKGIMEIMPLLFMQSIKLFFVLFFKELPILIAKMVAAFVESLIEGVKQIGEAIGNLFKADPEKKAERQERRAERRAARQAAFSGMDFVPATMKMTVHKGEAIIPADRNAKMQSGGPHTAGYAQAFGAQGKGQSGAPIEIAVVAEGRLLDAVQIKAADRGHATGMKKAIRRASGAKVGFQRGRFNAWS